MSEATFAQQWEACRVLYEFARGIDRRDWVRYRSVFCDEFELDYTSYRPGSSGRMRAEDWVARAAALFEGLDATQHSLSNPIVDIDGDRARVSMYVQAEHVLTELGADGFWTLGGYYDDELVRTDAGWKIDVKRLVVTWSRGNRDVLRLAAERGRKTG